MTLPESLPAGGGPRERGQPPWSRADLAIAVALTLVAALPRFAGIGDLRIDHYDAGGYAIGATAVAEGRVPEGFLERQHFLSPPLYFGLSGLLMRATGAHDTSLFIVSAILGTLTAPLLFLAGRFWFGRAAGAAAGILLALSSFHITFARAALTDAAFLFFFLLAVVLFGVALSGRRLVWTILAGLATGLAWNTKYHGWFAPVLAAAALLPPLLARDWRGARRIAIRLALAAGIAALCYLPWFLYVQGIPGGYEQLASRQGARSLSEAHMWRRNIRIYAEGQDFLETWTAVASVPLALLVALAAQPRRRSLLASLLVLAVLTAGAAAFGATPVLAALALAAALGSVWRRRFDHVLPLAFFGIFTFASPLYHPYARLLLPWSAASMLWSGDALARIAAACVGLRARRPALAPLGLLAAAALIATAFLREDLSADGDGGAADLPSAARRIIEATPGGEPVGVIGELPLVYYLREAGRDARPVNSPEGIARRWKPGTRIVLVSGLYSRRNPAWNAWRERRDPGERWETIPFHPSVVRMLDDYDPPSIQGDPRVRDAHRLEFETITVPDP